MSEPGTASDVAGEVVEVGPGVTNFKAGDKVVAVVNPMVSGCIYLLDCFPVSLGTSTLDKG